MKSNIWRVGNQRETLRYICRSGKRSYEDRAVVIAANVSRDVSRAADEMRAVAGLRPDSKRHFVHFVLSLKRGELTRAEWEFAVRMALDGLGLDPRFHLFLAAVHVGGMHQHCHVVAGRVGLDGRLWVGEHDMRRLSQATRQIVRDLDIAHVEENGHPGDHHSVANINRALRRRGMPLLSGQEITQSLLECLSNSSDMESFLKLSGERGLPIARSFDASGTLKGLVLSVRGTAYRLGLGKLTRGRITLRSVLSLLQQRQQELAAARLGDQFDWSDSDAAWHEDLEHDEQFMPANEDLDGPSDSNDSARDDSGEHDIDRAGFDSDSR
ncbi:MAG: relaxase/mobilization nuclease domain-containing protein [Nitrospirota bacterium]|nr:relaxase/mobilization nuclease domain-containing protein [Nitrospirota bacterium]